VKPRTFRYLTREGMRGLTRHRGMTATSVMTLTAGLLVLGVFLLVTFNVTRLLAGLESRKEVAVYLKDGTPAEAREQIEHRFALHPAVAKSTFVSKEEAWDEFSASVHVDGLLDAVGENPLPDSFRLELKPDFRDAATIHGLEAEVKAWDEVEDVVTGGDWLLRLDRFARIVMWVTLAVGLAVALSIMAIVSNTVRLTVVARQDLIEIMKQVGASEGFIRLPFVSEGFLVSLLAGGLALGALFGATMAVDGRLGGVEFLSPLWCGAFVAFAVVAGTVGSLLSVRSVLGKVGF